MSCLLPNLKAWVLLSLLGGAALISGRIGGRRTQDAGFLLFVFQLGRGYLDISVMGTLRKPLFSRDLCCCSHRWCFVAFDEDAAGVGWQVLEAENISTREEVFRHHFHWAGVFCEEIFKQSSLFWEKIKYTRMRLTGQVTLLFFFPSVFPNVALDFDCASFSSSFSSVCVGEE